MPLRLRKAAWDKNTLSRLGSLPFQHSTRARARSHSREASPPTSCEKETLENPRRGQGTLSARAALCFAGQTRAATGQLCSGTGRGGGGKCFQLVQVLARARDPEKARPGFNF